MRNGEVICSFAEQNTRDSEVICSFAEKNMRNGKVLVNLRCCFISIYLVLMRGFVLRGLFLAVIRRSPIPQPGLFGAAAMCSTADTSGVNVKELLETKLTSKFSPALLEVINESYMHNVPKGAQSHFKVIVVSEDFKGQTLLNRHKAVQETIKDEIANLIHAISITAKTPEEWDKTNPGSLKSPPCLGGMKAEGKV
ncbi:putative Protein BolA-like protein [Hypsibius exemplaris]|uniref:BolA-like protein 1 n=1 Tax=Hypsibius exemplaris TaxID=2072580 RepID=A0A1W0X238_HYPEX|nr:putative Protein BolA-like protein [Hypsibius exemplaris]